MENWGKSGKGSRGPRIQLDLLLYLPFHCRLTLRLTSNRLVPSPEEQFRLLPKLPALGSMWEDPNFTSFLP